MFIAAALPLLAAAALAQSADPSDIELAEPYVDASFRFSVRPPKNWGLDVQRSLAPGEAMLLQMSDPSPATFRPEIAVKWVAQPPATTVAQFVARFRRELATATKDLTVVADEARTLSGRPGAVLVSQFTLMRRPVLQMLAVVRSAPGSFYTLTFTGPYVQPELARRLFDRVVASVTLLGDEHTDAQLKGALVRTRAWLDGLRTAKPSDRLQPPLCLRIAVDRREQGYVLITEERFTLQRSEGVRVRESGWTFPSAGEVRAFESNLFVSDDGELEAWDSKSIALPPAQAGMPRALEYAYEEGLRHRDILLTSQSYRLGQSPSANPHLKLPDGYVSRLLLRWLPRLVDLRRPSLYAATMYDHRRGGLVLRTIEVLGPANVARPVGSRPAPSPSSPGAFRVLDREGLAAQPVELLFDESGRLLRSTAGALLMEPIELENAQRRWSRRIAAGTKEIESLAADYAKADSRFAPPPRP